MRTIFTSYFCSKHVSVPYSTFRRKNKNKLRNNSRSKIENLYLQMNIFEIEKSVVYICTQLFWPDFLAHNNFIGFIVDLDMAFSAKPTLSMTCLLLWEFPYYHFLNDAALLQGMEFTFSKYSFNQNKNYINL